MVLNIDLPATMLEIAGIKQPVHYHGGGLTSMANGKSIAMRDLFFCEHRMDNQRLPKWQGIREQRYVYVNYYEEKLEFLYGLQKDPQQLSNLAKEPEYKSILKKTRRDSEARRKKHLNNSIRKK